MKILVVDDEELEEDGYNIVTATTCSKGMEFFQKENPDLVTLDVCMSYNDEGIKLLGQMKSIRPGVPMMLAYHL